MRLAPAQLSGGLTTSRRRKAFGSVRARGGVPPDVEAALGNFLKCGILSHGFAPPDARFGAVAFVHRFGIYLNSHVNLHILVTDGVFSAGAGGEAAFHPALDLDQADFVVVRAKMRTRDLRWLHRHGHADDNAIHARDSSENAGGWSGDASVAIPGWNRHLLEQVVRYCARPPLS